MTAALGNTPALHHDDAVGMLDGGQPVCDHQRRASLHQGGQGRLHMLFGFAVQGRGGFIQQQDRRIFQQGAGNRQALALATRQTHTILANQGVKAHRHIADEFECMCRLRCALDFLACDLAATAVGNIGRDGVIE